MQFPRVTLAAVAVALLILPTVALASDPAVENSDAPMWATSTAIEPLAKIREIRAPLLAAPAITTMGQGFDVELAVSADAVVADVWLVDDPDYPTLTNGAIGGRTCPVTWDAAGTGPSRLWGDTPGLDVRFLTVTLGAPKWDGHVPCRPGVYDLVVLLYDPDHEPADWADYQLNAVSVMPPQRYHALASGAAEPRFAVIADPQVGDPRAFEDGVKESAAEQSTRPFAENADGVLGDGSDAESGRWKAMHAVWEAIRAEDVDFVLIAGDLGFGQAVPGSYAAEYEEIWRMLEAADVPVFASPGNHDGYVANGLDGFAWWRAYVGPTYYATEAVPGTWLVSLNTYDWSELDRTGASFAVSAWGGQVRDAQLAWLDATLTDVRAADPDARVLTLSHHSPSWRQDQWQDEDPTGTSARVDGEVPVAEQVARGAVSYGTTDQAWSGENRLALRDVLRAHDVEVHFAGHTHRDRVARDDGAGRIVETHQSFNGMPEDYDPRDLHYFTRDDALIHGHAQDALADLVRTAPGPLYVETTTALSGTSQYWGYRVVDVAYTPGGHLDLPRFGHAITQEELDAFAAEPELFNVAHAELGLFSKPLVLESGMPWKALEHEG